MSVINEEKIKNHLDAILQAIQTEADPHLLNEYRALIRKNVSFFQRSYLAAYLLMLQEQPQGRQRISGGDKSRNKSKIRNNSAAAEPVRETEPARQGRRSEAAQQPPASVALPEDEATRLFISIGRNRRVFPREILGLIGSRTSVSKDDIGTINILNNYSFVQVRNSAAAEIVETLNGAGFRGRTLTVNYARTRQEEDGDIPAGPVSRPLEDDASASDALAADAMDTGTVDAGYDDAVDADVMDAGYDDAVDIGARAVDIDDEPAEADEPTGAAGSGEATSG